MLSKEELLKRVQRDFTYHRPTEEQIYRYKMLRESGLALASRIVINTPVSREQSLALTYLEQAIMYANAAIARNENE